MLRLSTAAVGPVTVAAGANGPAQTVEAYNAGSGSLSLTVASSATWLAPTLQASRNCTTRSGSCLPVLLTLNTSSLAAGSYTALVTVTDPNAVDAPQNISVTVQIGSGVPSALKLYAAPGGAADATFATNSALTTRVSTTDPNNWLSIGVDGTGSFRLVIPYRVHAAPAPNQAEGSYSGTVVTSNSTFAGDNKTIAVSLNVTSQPIVQVTPIVTPVSSVSASGINLQLAQGAPAYTLGVGLSNSGSGTLTVSSAVATGGAWLTTVTAAPAYVSAVIDASKLTPGIYNGTLTIASNAANGSVVLPVNLTVVAAAAPRIAYQGAVDNAIFVPGDPVSRGGILALMGDQLSLAPVTLGKAAPLDTKVGGAQVLVNGQPAPMYYSTYGQLAFQMPYETPNGTALVQVNRDGQTSNTVSVGVVDLAPRLLKLGIANFGAIVNQDYSLPFPTSYQVSGWVTHPAHRGDTVTIYAIGLGATSPAVGSGQPAPAAEPLARVTTTPVVTFSKGVVGSSATPLYAGLTPSYAGLYQVNATIPNDAPSGIVSVIVSFPGAVSNAVDIAIE